MIILLGSFGIFVISLAFASLLGVVLMLATNTNQCPACGLPLDALPVDYIDVHGCPCDWIQNPSATDNTNKHNGEINA